MSKNSDNFLFGCKNLYFLSIHPFHFDKKNRKEYVELVDLGKLVLEEEGIQIFLGYLLEYQYRVSVWASMISLEYGKPNLNEMLQRVCISAVAVFRNGFVVCKDNKFEKKRLK